MQTAKTKASHVTTAVFLAGAVAGGVATTLGVGAIAAATAPSEHKGLKVETLGVIAPQSMQTTIG
ncbi:MAG: hypothetical protein HKN11_07550, partial [Rhizobiales bacterium]|nr:hypothetical protein [Hyphomicrobiales bacterium]